MLVNDVRRLFVGFSVQLCPEAQVRVNALAVASCFPNCKGSISVCVAWRYLQGFAGSHLVLVIFYYSARILRRKMSSQEIFLKNIPKQRLLFCSGSGSVRGFFSPSSF